MDIHKPVTYRGLTLNGADLAFTGENRITGMRIKRVNYASVSVHGYTEKRSADDGFDASDVFLGVRQVEMQAEVFGVNRAELYDFLDLLRLKMTPTDAYAESPGARGYLPLAFVQPTQLTIHWPTGSIDRQLNVRPMTQPSHELELASSGGDDDGEGMVVPLVLRWEAKDPRFYHPTPQEVVLSGITGSGDLTNRGNYPAPLNFLLVVGAGESAGTFDFQGVGTDMSIEIPDEAAEQIIRVDSVNKVVTQTIGTVETLRMDLPTFNAGTTWPKVPPTPEGDTPAGYSWTSDASLEATSKMFFSEAWV